MFVAAGIYTALITPFKSDLSIDWLALERLVKDQVQAGVTGLVPCGTTGESPTLTHEEHSLVIQKVTLWAKQTGDVCIMAGTGSNSTKEAIEITKRAEDIGVDVSLQVNPYYNKPNQDGLKQHFTEIANSVTIPIVLYNIPGRTSVKLSLETMVALAKHPRIVGVKEATGDLNFVIEVLEATKNLEFEVLSGDDNLSLPILSIGGTGVVSVCSNVLPKTMCGMMDLFVRKELEKTKLLFYSITNFCNHLFVETNPIPIKYVCSRLGICENYLRLPLVPLNKKFHTILDEDILRLKKNNTYDKI